MNSYNSAVPSMTSLQMQRISHMFKKMLGYTPKTSKTIQLLFNEKQDNGPALE